MTREEAIARIKDHMSVHKIYEERAVKITEALNMAIEALKAQMVESDDLKAESAQNVQKGDLISRKLAIDAVQHAFDRETLLNSFVCKVAVDALKTMPSAQHEPSTDIQDVFRYLDDVLHPLVSPDNWNVYSELHDMISRLPSAQSERKTGKWMLTEPDAPCFYRCNKCGRLVDFEEHYCPSCGAYMKGERTE